MQLIHPRPPSHRRRWLHCGFPLKSSRIRHRCSSPICATSGPAYSHIHPRGRFRIWLMCIWRHKCHSFWTTCSSVGPAKEFRIHWSFLPLWSATSLTIPITCTRPSNQPLTWSSSHYYINLFQTMGCLGNSKTEDQRNEDKEQRENNKKINKQLQKDKQIYRATHRLLLLGGFCRIYCYRLCSQWDNLFTHLFFFKEEGLQCFKSCNGEIWPHDAIGGWCHSTVSGHSWTCLRRSCMIVEQDQPVRRLTSGYYCVKATHGGSETPGSAFCLLLSLSFHSEKQIQCSVLVLVPLARMCSVSDTSRLHILPLT